MKPMADTRPCCRADLPRAFWSRLSVALVLACVSGACSRSPTTPTPAPPADPGPPTISCPSAVTVQSADGGSVPVTYSAPTATGGFQPLTGPTCAPASDSLFAPGATRVSCTVTDAKQRADTCTFAVTVTLPPRISVTRVLAFGDSMTWGEDGTTLTLQPFQDAAASHPAVRFPTSQTYPGVLEADLRARYTTQSPTVTNAGLVGEAVTAPTTFSRFTSYTSSRQYDVVLILEGANDLADRDATIELVVIAGLRRMVQDAKSRGIIPVLATLPPQKGNGCCPNRGLAWSLVPGFNDRVKTLAASEAVLLVDVYQAFANDPTTLIGADGLHPTSAGYRVMGDAFYNVIRQVFETRPSARR